MNDIKLHFHGPLAFTPGQQCLFHSPLQSAACVYLWTIQSEIDSRFYIHYVGEAAAFARRQREHLIQVLGLNYGIFDPAEARKGVQSRIWEGLWRDRSPEGQGRLLEKYSQITNDVLRYVEALSVFVAETTAEPRLRKHIEGSIGWNLRNNHASQKMLYPDDNYIGTMATKVGTRLCISSDASIAGLDSDLEI